LMLMVLFENVHVFNCRSETRSAFALSPLRSPVLMCGILVAFSIHVSMLYLPLGQSLLDTQPLSASQWMMIATLSLPILLVMELHKAHWRWREKRAVTPA